MKRKHFRLLKTIVIIIVAPAVFLLSDIYCAVRLVTGIPCPTCGVTRACIAAMQFDFSHAFFYHPLFFLAPVIPAVLLYEAAGVAPRRKRLLDAVLILCAFLFFAVYLVRFANGSVWLI